MEEIAFAWKNKEAITGSNVLFEGVTTNEIKVVLVDIGNELKTVYPKL